MVYDRHQSGALAVNAERPTGPLPIHGASKITGRARDSALFAAQMENAGSGQAGGRSAATRQEAAQTSLGQSRAQALDTLNRMLEDGEGGDTLHSLRSTLSNMALADLTRLSQTEAGAAILDNGGGRSATVQAPSLLDSAARFAVENIERIRTAPRRRAQQERTGSPKAENGPLGAISAQFESGNAGIAAIGYDRTGGTSYGKYQIASKPGSMDQFVKFLKTEAPDLAERLEKAGPADTGSKTGAMPTAWKAIAQEQPERFEQLQSDFIAKSHFEPALSSIRRQTGIEPTEMSGAVKEALWSTAVQHGPSAASRIFVRALSSAANAFSGGTAHGEAAASAGEVLKQSEEGVIREVYAIRATQFGSSTGQVRDSVQKRLHAERDMVLAYAAGEKQTTVA